MLKVLVRKAVAAVVAAACAGVAVVALGFAVFFALDLVMPPLAASALTFGLFALVALIVATLFLRDGDSGGREVEEAEPEGLASRAVHLIREHPLLGAAGGLGALFFLLRNPALAAIVASMVTERRMEKRGYRRRR